MNPVRKLVSYFRSSAEELKKVSWPTRRDTVRYSALVIGVSLGIAVFFGALDAGLTKLVDVLIARRAASSIQLPPPETPATEPATTSQPASPSINFDSVQPIVTPTDDKK